MSGCLDCGKSLSSQNKQGRCRRCALIEVNRRPEIRARRSTDMRRINADPVHKANLSVKCRIAQSTPEALARCSEAGKKGHPSGRLTPEHRAKIAASLRAYFAERKLPEGPSLTPFEKQLQLVLSGKAQVVQNIKYRPANGDRTLGGVPSGLLA